MAKDKRVELAYKLEGQRRMANRKIRRLRKYINLSEKRREHGGCCCEYGSGPDCDWSC